MDLIDGRFLRQLSFRFDLSDLLEEDLVIGLLVGWMALDILNDTLLIEQENGTLRDSFCCQDPVA